MLFRGQIGLGLAIQFVQPRLERPDPVGELGRLATLLLDHLGAGVLEGLAGRRSEFVRTPKSRALSTAPGGHRWHGLAEFGAGLALLAFLVLNHAWTGALMLFVIGGLLALSWLVASLGWDQIVRAREYYADNGVVPPIRKFAKYAGENQKDMFKLWMTGPMKPITKYGGLPKPTGCV